MRISTPPFCVSSAERAMAGVAFLIHKDCLSQIKDWNFINDTNDCTSFGVEN